MWEGSHNVPGRHVHGMGIVALERRVLWRGDRQGRAQSSVVVDSDGERRAKCTCCGGGDRHTPGRGWAHSGVHHKGVGQHHIAATQERETGAVT